jgi:hypothetical protein
VLFVRWTLFLAPLFLAACEPSMRVVPLLDTAGVPITQPTNVPLRVVTRSTAVQDPLRLDGYNVSYGDIESALGHAVASGTAPWADSHRAQGRSTDGWELFVEITNADAHYEDARVVFSLGVRATLRARSGNVYLAQTQAMCRQGGLAEPDQGGPIIYKCMTEIGRDLGGWLDGVDLEAVASRR